MILHGCLDPYVFSYRSLVKKVWFFLEKKIIQVALFKLELNKLEIRIESSCSGGYRDFTTLIVYQKDLENLRKVNNIEKFQRGYKNTPLNFYKQIELAVKSLCF